MSHLPATYRSLCLQSRNTVLKQSRLPSPGFCSNIAKSRTRNFYHSVQRAQPRKSSLGTFEHRPLSFKNFPNRPLQSGVSLTSLLTGLILLSLSASIGYALTSSPAEETTTNQQTNEQLFAMPTEQPGRPGTLTPEEEAKLRALWILNARLFGFIPTDATPKPSTPIGKENPATKTEEATTPQKAPAPSSSRFNIFRSSPKPPAAPEFTSAVAAEVVNASDAANDKHGQNQQFKDAMASSTPGELRDAFWSMVKHDHPDALLLRFLRARKWDVHAAEVMAISALHWRITDAKVDSDIMLKGEGGMAEDSVSATGKEMQMGKDFIGQFKLGKSFVKGNDREGRPLCYIRVRKHRAGDYSEESLERYTVHTIETARMMLRTPVDTATIVFDMTDFGLANMDYPPVKFMIKCFEANYPESLGAILIHKAPWIFQGIWRVIRGWLDPVVASKVNFTNSAAELEKFIEPSLILKELGGANAYEYKYLEPVAGENDKMKDEEGKKTLLEERKVLSEKYEGLIKEWLKAEKNVDGSWAALKKQRDEVAEELKTNYWKLDPYIRAKSIYDRNGEMKAQNPESAVS